MSKLKRLEIERGNLDEVIPSLVNRNGQHVTAKALGVSAATINKWLKDNGYVRRQFYVKEAVK
jgi:hypothetical protein